MKDLYRLEVVPQVGVYSTSSTQDPQAIDLICACRSLMAHVFVGTLSGPKHPGPHSDSLLCDAMRANGLQTDDLFFGFSSIDQFRAWFYSDSLLKDFDKFGVTLVCYNITKILIGNAQACGLIKERDPKNVKWRISLNEFLAKGIPKE